MPKSKKSKKDSTEEKVLESLPRSVEQKVAGSFAHIIGVDEAGRGPLAGPVVAAACIIENGVSIEGIIDSKQTKEEDREKSYEILVRHPSVVYGVSIVSHTEIDEVNILQATMNAMKRATNDLLLKLSKSKTKVAPTDCIALIDGNRIPTDMPVEAKYVIKGDGSIFSIAAASIIAKVTRDRIMVELDKKYPQYNLAQHKGYPTFEHRTLLMKHGPSEIHRTSYGPVKQAMLAHGIPLPVKKGEENVEEIEPVKVSKSTKTKRSKEEAVTEKTVSKKIAVKKDVVKKVDAKKTVEERTTTKTERRRSKSDIAAVESAPVSSRKRKASETKPEKLVEKRIRVGSKMAIL